MNELGKSLGEVRTIQLNGEDIKEAKRGNQVAIALPSVTVGRNLFENENILSDLNEEEFRTLKDMKQFLETDEINLLKIIAEIKRASPSKGVICPDLDAAAYASEYEKGGACAISVLTDRSFFMGNSDDLIAARKASDLPVLRKDFIIDPYQIYEASAAGADSILLIARILTKEQIDTFLALAYKLGMECLVEVHNNTELKKVMETKAAIIGINNRNLDTFETNLETTLQLCHFIPEGRIIVSESGIKTRANVLKLEEAGIDAILIGETLMRSKDIFLKMKELFGN